MRQRMMRVCYFGTYELQYPRNRLFIDGLRQSGVSVEEIHFNQWDRGPDKLGILKNISAWCIALPRLLFGYVTLCSRLWSSWTRFDVIVVGYIGQPDVVLVEFVRMLLILTGWPCGL